MSVITHLSWPLVILLLCFCPAQVFSFQDTAVLPVSSNVHNDGLHNQATVLVRYTEKNNLLGEPEGGALLQVYIDGYVTVYYPAYMRRAGKYGKYLTQGEMERLWALLNNKNILQFNKQTVRQRLYASDQMRRELLMELSEVADAATALIEIYPNRYQLTDFGGGDKDAKKNISWYGLRWDARKYSDVPEIQPLVALQQELQAIMQRPDLQTIE